MPRTPGQTMNWFSGVSSDSVPLIKEIRLSRRSNERVLFLSTDTVWDPFDLEASFSCSAQKFEKYWKIIICCWKGSRRGCKRDKNEANRSLLVSSIDLPSFMHEFCFCFLKAALSKGRPQDSFLFWAPYVLSFFLPLGSLASFQLNFAWTFLKFSMSVLSVCHLFIQSFWSVYFTCSWKPFRPSKTSSRILRSQKLRIKWETSDVASCEVWTFPFFQFKFLTLWFAQINLCSHLSFEEPSSQR